LVDFFVRYPCRADGIRDRLSRVGFHVCNIRHQTPQRTAPTPEMAGRVGSKRVILASTTSTEAAAGLVSPAKGNSGMPLYEYRCRYRRQQFEGLARRRTPFSRAVCRSAAPERLSSLFGIATDGTRQPAVRQARQRGETHVVMPPPSNVRGSSITTIDMFSRRRVKDGVHSAHRAAGLLPGRARRLVAAALLVLSATYASAADLGSVLTGYTLTSWGQKDGLPPSVIWAVARDSAGYLWLGSDSGLIRFDGVRFVPWRPRDAGQLPDSAVRSLVAARDGSLWIGFGEPGGVSRLTNGDVMSYGRDHGLPEGAVTMLVEEPDGSVWAGNRQGLFRLSVAGWEPAGPGLPKSIVYSMHIDRHGRRFVATAEGLFRRDAGREKFEPADDLAGVVRGVAGDAWGRIWTADSVVGFRQFGARKSEATERGNGSSMLRDSRGNLWVGTGGQGLWRVRLDGPSSRPFVERTNSLIGFSDDGVTSIMEDGDGSIWVTTYDGLNRLVPHRMTPVINLGLIGGIEATADGSVWLGTVDALLRFPPSRLEPTRVPQAFHGVLPSAMHADDSGALWLATSRELLRIVDGRASAVPLSELLQRISAITSDARGGIWIADRDRGLFRWDKGQMTALALPAELTGIQIVRTHGDRAGRVWLSFADGTVGVVDAMGVFKTRVRAVAARNEVVRAIYEDINGAIWLGSNRAVMAITDDAMTSIDRENGFPVGSVISIVGDEGGGLWVGLEGIGIARFSAEELRKAQDDPSHQVRYRLYDKFDGFAGAPRWRGNSSAARSRDGRLWFVSARGITMVEPRTLEDDRTVPVQVSIDGGEVDGQPIQIVQSMRLRARTAGVEIEYTIPNLLSPLKTRFRYRLDGFDPDWVNAGTRRQAFYTNLPPRAYRFRVQATNADGTWDEHEASWEFAINARFYQTGWFMAGVIAAAIAVPWAAWRLRIRQVRSQFSLLLAERGRLSREIHDTVLQGLIGLGLQCDAIAGEVEAKPLSATRERLLAVRRDAEEFVREARQSILSLRSPKLQSVDLVSALRQAGLRATRGRAISFDMTVSGAPSGRWADAEEQLYRIAREALANAVQHSNCRSIHVELTHEANAVVLRVTDDGDGFNVDSIVDANGHCGLVSMRERAEGIGGTFTVTSSIGHGARVEVVVPTSDG
jgi:signal transduction histidine kinase/ligand-binding sensor domain-containing protein